MFGHYKDLWLSYVEEERREYHQYYTYLVTEISTPHTAFRTLAGLELWLQLHGLKMPQLDKYGNGKIIGGYHSHMFMDSFEFHAIEADCYLPVLSNGSYTLGKACSIDGVVHIYHLNPNVRTRPALDYWACEKALSKGINPFAFIPRSMLNFKEVDNA